LKILHVYKDYDPPVKGGIESHIHQLAVGLKENGIDVQVLVANRKNKFEMDCYDGISIAKAPQLGRFYSAPLMPTFHCYLRRYGQHADIIHFHYPNPTAEFAYLFTNLRKKLVVTYHSDIIRQDKLGKLYAPFRELFLKKADRIIATSPNYIESSHVLKRHRHKCTVIPLGIDSNRFCATGDQKAIQTIRDTFGERPLVLFVGCLRYYKGLHLLIAAMEKVDAKLIIVGAGPEQASLQRLVERKKLSNKVFLMGELSDESVNAYYHACDIFVLPSHLRSEAYGIVQLEAMCCRKPVICADLGTGTSFVTINQRTGLTVEPNNVSAMVGGLTDLIAHPDKRARLGECGYARVQEMFTSPKMVSRTIELYKAVLAS
jgi:rhamnosyl/mannosyltransferase